MVARPAQHHRQTPPRESGQDAAELDRIFQRPLPRDPAGSALAHQRRLNAGEPLPGRPERSHRRLQLIGVRTIFRVIHNGKLAPRRRQPVVERPGLGPRQSSWQHMQLGALWPAFALEREGCRLIPGFGQQLHVEPVCRIIERTDRCGKLRRRLGFVLQSDQQCVDGPVLCLVRRPDSRFFLHPRASEIHPDPEEEDRREHGKTPSSEDQSQHLRRPDPAHTGNRNELRQGAALPGAQRLGSGFPRLAKLEANRCSVRAAAIWRRVHKPACSRMSGAFKEALPIGSHAGTPQLPHRFSTNLRLKSFL